MENPDFSENSEKILSFFPSEFSDENDHYDDYEDDYDLNEEDSYDDGISGSTQDDDGYEGIDEESDESEPESGLSAFREELEDSLSETEDYDSIDD